MDFLCSFIKEQKRRTVFEKCGILYWIRNNIIRYIAGCKFNFVKAQGDAPTFPPRWRLCNRSETADTYARLYFILFDTNRIHGGSGTRGFTSRVKPMASRCYDKYTARLSLAIDRLLYDMIKQLLDSKMLWFLSSFERIFFFCHITY